MRRSRFSILFLGVLIAMSSYATSTLDATKNIFFKCVETTSSGVILSTEADKVAIIQKEAVKLLLLEGIESKSCGNQRPLLKTSESVKAFESIEKEFFSKKGDYQRFVTIKTSSSEVIVEVKTKNLSEYLIEQGIIKKLSNGF
jgi:hypothetical protein